MVFTVPNKPTPESWEFFDLGGRLNQRRFYKPHGDIREMKNKKSEFVYNPVWAKRFANTKGSLTVDAEKVKRPPSSHEEALAYLRNHLSLSRAFRRGLDYATENNSLIPGSMPCNEDTLATPHSIATTDRSGEPIPKYHRPTGGDPRLATPHMNFWKKTEGEARRPSSIVPPLDLKMRRRSASVAGARRASNKFETNSDRGGLEPLDANTLERVESFKKLVEAGEIMKYLPDERVRTALGTVRKRIEILRTGKDGIRPPRPMLSQRSVSQASSRVDENSMADLFDLPPTPVSKMKGRSALTPTTFQARTKMLQRIYHPMTPQGLQKFEVGSADPPKVELLPAKTSPTPVESVRPFEAI